MSLSPDDLSALRNRLLAFCYQLLASPFEAEDAVQDTMERAWRARKYRLTQGKTPAASWLVSREAGSGSSLSN
ncbi:sigma factor [Sinomonas sp.]|uniref:sigma factor n=1 Tax=Sinomonas sp. TaxID=1914986 RepID=UPI003F8134AB